MRTTRGLLVAVALVCSTGCPTPGPRLVDDSIQGAKVSFGNLETVAEQLSQKLVQSGFLKNEKLPVIMVLSDINNKTDVRNLPTDSVLGRVRAVCLNSGLIRFISTIGRGSKDNLAGEIQDIANDPRFNKSQAPKKGSLTVPTHSLRTEINYKRDAVSGSTQRTYDFHLFVTDLTTGEIRWEEFETVKIRVGKNPVGS